jgi:SLT domain-containing protein
MINVKQESDNSFTISWDKNDPQESIFNNWTEEDFINAIQDYLNTLEELGEVDNATEAINQVTYYIEQTAEEVEQDIQTLKDYIEQDEEDRRPRLFF